eukprot:5791-Heterococcus_DN1.PRE.3
MALPLPLSYSQQRLHASNTYSYSLTPSPPLITSLYWHQNPQLIYAEHFCLLTATSKSASSRPNTAAQHCCGLAALGRAARADTLYCCLRRNWLKCIAVLAQCDRNIGSFQNVCTTGPV